MKREDIVLKIITTIKNSSVKLNDLTLFNISNWVSFFLNSEYEEDNHAGRQILIHILDNWSKIPDTYNHIFSDLIEACGFYPYLEKEKNVLQLEGTRELIRKEFHKSIFLDKYLHSAQKRLSDLLLNTNRNIVVSAPTSFGKSLLIEEIVASKKYQNIVIIQPTLALLNETRNKLKKYEDHYKLIIRTSQKVSSTKGNLFLLTAERVVEFPNLPDVDFFILDEFYKISKLRDDERYEELNKACIRLIQEQKCRFYFLGPPIGNFSEEFLAKFNAEYINFNNYNIVDVEEEIILNANSLEFMVRKEKTNKKQELFSKLYEMKDEQTIIYCSSPNVSLNLALEFSNFLATKNIKKTDLPLINWLEEYISEDWDFIKCLQQGIGVHNGAFQKHVNASIIKYFNNRKINFLFCTSTIIEGVNTSAKNVIIYENKKAHITIDKFDKANIKGRAGRLMEHYVGKLYTFHEKLEEISIDVDVPFVDQTEPSTEILIHLDDNNIKDKYSQEYKLINSLSDEERELFKMNGISIEGQKHILDYIMQNFREIYNLIRWNNYPTKEQLSFIINLCWSHLLKSSEKKAPAYTANRLIALIFNYLNTKSIKLLINDEFKYLKLAKNGAVRCPVQLLGKIRNASDSEIHQIAILNILDSIRHWYSYKIPKWLLVMHNIQEFACKKNNIKSGNYRLLANLLENSFVSPNISILLELGIPNSAITKLKKYLPKDISEELVISNLQTQLREKIIDQKDFLTYEFDRINEEIL